MKKFTRITGNVTITMKSKRKYCSKKLLQFQGDTKKTWRII